MSVPTDCYINQPDELKAAVSEFSRADLLRRLDGGADAMLSELCLECDSTNGCSGVQRVRCDTCVAPMIFVSTLLHRRVWKQLRDETRLVDRRGQRNATPMEPYDHPRRAELRDEIEAILEGNDQLRRALELAVFSGHSDKQVARLMGIKPSTFGVLKYRLKQGLRDNEKEYPL